MVGESKTSSDSTGSESEATGHPEIDRVSILQMALAGLLASLVFLFAWLRRTQGAGLATSITATLFWSALCAGAGAVIGFLYKDQSPGTIRFRGIFACLASLASWLTIWITIGKVFPRDSIGNLDYFWGHPSLPFTILALLWWPVSVAWFWGTLESWLSSLYEAPLHDSIRASFAGFYSLACVSWLNLLIVGPVIFPQGRWEPYRHHDPAGFLIFSVCQVAWFLIVLLALPRAQPSPPSTHLP